MPFGTLPKKQRNRRGRKNRRAGRKTKSRVGKARGASTQRATLTEAYQVSPPDGAVIFNRALQLSSATFDRAQVVAQAYQEYCIKSVRLVFRPSADTFTPAAGNSMPNFYYLLDKAVAIPTNANLQTLLDMGCRPMRFDDKNITKSYKPVALLGNDTDTVGTIQAAQMSKASPWLSTNANAGNPGAVWSPSRVEHSGCVFFVTKMSGLTPTIQYTVDIQVDFAFRKPLWRVPGTGEPTPNMTLSGDVLASV